MDSCIVFAYIYVNFKWLLLQESDIEVINFVFKTKLGLVVGFQSFSHLGGLSRMVIEVDRAQRNQ
jgi:hypothetical protein